MSSEKREQTKGKRVIVIGEPSSVFISNLAEFLLSQELQVLVVTYSSPISKLLGTVQVISSKQHEPKALQLLLRILRIVAKILDKFIHHLYKIRFAHAMRDYDTSAYIPQPLRQIVFGISISSYINNNTNAEVVFGQQAFNYGIATALCKNTRRVVMPWGGDIFNYAETSPIAFNMVRWSMMQVDLVSPTSSYAAKHIRENFGVRNTRVEAISWGVDLKQFTQSNSVTNLAIREKYKIQSNSLIVTNIRRLHPAWGASTVLSAFIKLALETDIYHFILLGGNEAAYKTAIEQIEEAKIGKRFTVFQDLVPLSEYAEIMSITDIAVSIMHKRDMRSSSILQACASGAVPVLSDQAEYRLMEEQGFKANFVPAKDVASVCTAIRAYGESNELRERIKQQNAVYIQKYEDKDTNLYKLLHKVLYNGNSLSY